jgi:hypothetical protein
MQIPGCFRSEQSTSAVGSWLAPRQVEGVIFKRFGRSWNWHDELRRFSLPRLDAASEEVRGVRFINYVRVAAVRLIAPASR